ncbi:MAG: NAD(P)H-binding protein [Deltaproteobacteria bacterium]|nr:MAG: NAD(P)H-binding protein [Deltaproteobacteria bacterium]
MMTQFKKSLRVVLFGATGLVGREVLTQLENNPQIFKIDVIGRRSVETSSPKTKFHFSDLESVKNILNFPADIALCCLGTTMAKAKSKEAFRHVDHDLVLNVARACSSVGITTFGVISSIGASINALSFYLKIKAEMEESLQKLSFDHLVILRPSLLLGERIEIRHLEKFSQKFSTFISPLCGASKTIPFCQSLICSALFN